MLDLVRLERSGTLPLDFRTQKSALVVPGFMGWDRATQGTCKKNYQLELKESRFFRSAGNQSTWFLAFWIFGAGPNKMDGGIWYAGLSVTNILR